MGLMNATCTIDELELPCVRPTAVAEVGEIVRQAASGDQAVYPIGGRTMLDLGMPPTKPGIAVDLTALDQVIDYPARDMTITVQTGITLAKLQSVLAAEGQRLPIDVPLPERATLGGAIACNVSGPRRYGFGTLRDYIIGISAINDEGQEFKAGGRVVKNVAGYDLCKLLTGSLGTLGIITQVTLKVRPVPEYSTIIDLQPERPVKLAALLDSIGSTCTRPVILTVTTLDATALILPSPWDSPSHPASPAEWCILIGLEGTQNVVEWQIGQLQKELCRIDAPIYRQRPGNKDQCHWLRLVDFPVHPASSVTFKANILPNAVADFCQFAESVAPLLIAHAGNGQIIGHLNTGIVLDQAKQAIQELRERAITAKGNLILTRCPPAWKKTLNVWGEPRGDWPLMRKIKQQFDPRNIFNPGRFVGGI